MNQPDVHAIALPSPQAIAPAPELGPLVRAQSVKVPGRSLAPLWPILGVVASKVLTRAGLSLSWVLVAAGAILGVGVVVEHIPALWRRLRLRRCPAWDGTGPAPHGPVRVTGRVRAIGEPFLLPGETEPLIFAHTRFAAARDDGRASKLEREDLRGLTLEIQLPTQTAVRLAPDALRLLDGGSAVPEVGYEVRSRLGAAWLGRSKGKLRRSRLREGDRVEAVGKLVRDVSVDGAAGPGRGIPMIHWLVPAWKGGVWIRRM